jgi:phosphoglycerate dehydrogenase-like enzyme
MKSILIPAHIFQELETARVQQSLDVRFIPYSEDITEAVDPEESVAIFRWIAGTRYAELIDRTPFILWLHTASAGVDHVITPTVKSRDGMILTDSGPAFGQAIAEFVFAAMLSDARRLVETAANQKAHIWEKLPQRELFGATIGIVGLGPIGLSIAALAKAFGMTTLGFRRTSKPAANVDEVLTGADGLRKLLEQSQYVVVAAALTGDTGNLIDADGLAAMRPDAQLINIGRGGLVDESALIDVLRNNVIRAAVLDVFTTEPLPSDSVLWDLPNVVITPHHSFGASAGLKARQIGIFLDNVRNYIDGKPLDNVVDIVRGY